MSNLYNLEYLRRISGDDLFIKDMVQTFVNDAPKNFYKMKRHFINRNFKELKEVVHAFKNMASYIGNQELINELFDLDYNVSNSTETMKIRENINQVDLLVHDIISKLKTDFRLY